MIKTEQDLDAGLLSNFVGASPAFMQSIALFRRFAPSKAPILIIGETGTGKELAAHAVHYLSDRRDCAFIVSGQSRHLDHASRNMLQIGEGLSPEAASDAAATRRCGCSGGQAAV